MDVTEAQMEEGQQKGKENFKKNLIFLAILNAFVPIFIIIVSIFK